MKQETQFLEVVGLIKQARTNAYQSVNAELINCYWQVGEYISNRIANASWGDKSIIELAKFIENSHPDLKGYNRSGLYRMRQFYETYCNTQIVATLSRQLQKIENHSIVTDVQLAKQLTDIRETILAQIGWSHHLIIIARTRTAEEREFYIRLCIRDRYSTRELDRQISSGLFERTMLGDQKLPPTVKQSSNDISSAFKSNYILEFLNLPKNHNESDLQQALADQDTGVVKYAMNRTLSPTLVASYQTQLPDKSILQQKWTQIMEETIK